MHFTRNFDAPKREGLTWHETWEGQDQGLIACWERGREMRLERPELAQRADNGELVLLPWKGGLEKALKVGRKYGTLNYLAMLQGLRGEKLDIDTQCEIERTCSTTGTRVIYTGDFNKTKDA